MTTKERTVTLDDLRKIPVPVPQPVLTELRAGAATLSAPLRTEFPWWSSLWPRPTAATWTQDYGLDEAQQAWDKSAEFVQNQRAVSAQFQAQRDTEAAQRVAERAAYEERQLDALTATLRRRYLSVPGKTEADFQAALPDLLEQYARQVALADDPAPVVSRRQLLG